MIELSGSTRGSPNAACRPGAVVIFSGLGFHPRDELPDLGYLKQSLDRRILIRQLGLREIRMYMAMADSMKPFCHSPALALRNQMVRIELRVRDRPIA